MCDDIKTIAQLKQKVNDMTPNELNGVKYGIKLKNANMKLEIQEDLDCVSMLCGDPNCKRTLAPNAIKNRECPYCSSLDVYPEDSEDVWFSPRISVFEEHDSHKQRFVGFGSRLLGLKMVQNLFSKKIASVADYYEFQRQRNEKYRNILQAIKEGKALYTGNVTVYMSYKNSKYVGLTIEFQDESE